MDDTLNRQLLKLLARGAKQLSMALGWTDEGDGGPYKAMTFDAGRPIMPGPSFQDASPRRRASRG
jgi:hypothetical protein